MTRLSPSHDERTRDTAPHRDNASKWVFQFIYITYSILSILQQWYNVSYWGEDNQCYKVHSIDEDKSNGWGSCPYITYNVLPRVLQCVQLRRGQIYGWDSGPNVTHSMSHQLVQCVLMKGEQLLALSDRAVALILSMHIMWQPWKETISHFCDTLEMWILLSFMKELSVLWNFSYPDLTLHTMRLVSPWGHPGNPADHHTA